MSSSTYCWVELCPSTASRHIFQFGQASQQIVYDEWSNVVRSGFVLSYSSVCFLLKLILALVTYNNTFQSFIIARIGHKDDNSEFQRNNTHILGIKQEFFLNHKQGMHNIDLCQARHHA